MVKRPQLHVELSVTDKVLEIFGWLLVLAIWILVTLTYFKLPSTIPTHFNASGQPNNYGSKSSYLSLPVLGTLLFTGMTILNKYPWIFNYINYTYTNAAQQYTYATKMIRFLKTAIIFVFFLVNLLTWLTATGRSTGLGKWFLPFSLLLFIIPSALYIIKTVRSIKAR